MAIPNKLTIDGGGKVSPRIECYQYWGATHHIRRPC